MDYEVKLEIFEGPMDLLLHLIRKNEVDIFDIPIAAITDQYLKYIDIMRTLNISLAGDFLVMASTLIHIKSKMLLPGFEEEGEGDPRVEITRPLLEYLRLKELAGELSERELLERDVFTRRLSLEYRDQFEGEESLLDVSLFQLIDAFKRIVDEKAPGVPVTFQGHKWSVKDKMTFIMERLKNDGAIYFIGLFKEDRTVSELIVTFLALLELVQMHMVRIFQTDHDKDIQLKGLFDNIDQSHDPA